MSASGRPAGLRRTASIDLSAFARNITSWLAMHGDAVWDARADAFGHGLAALVPVALESGIETIRISPHQEQEARRFAQSVSTTVAPGRTVLGVEAYGLSGPGTAVMTLSGEVVAVKPAEAGAGVSYGYSYRTTRNTTLALVGLGYADGVPRLASNRAMVVVAGGPYPLVGRVAMDQFVVDCAGSVPEVGETATLFGDATAGLPTALEWAAHTRRSALELTAGLGPRILREYR